MKKNPVVEILCIGSELLSGKPNTHIDYFARRLKSIGLTVSRCTTVTDALDDLTEAVKSAIKRADVVVAAGGLGPTFDDLTREAVSAATGRDLHYVPRLFAGIRLKFRVARVPMPEENKRQAFLIKGAEAIENPNGSAPGQTLVHNKTLLVLLPGPFNEMSPMFESDVLPLLRRRFGGRATETMSLHFAGLAESAVDHAITPVINATKDPVAFTILGGPGLAHFYATASAATHSAARAILARIRRRLPRDLAAHLYSESDPTLEAAVGGLLKKSRKKLATAESCTGGLLSARLTDIAGSSDYFVGGVVAYANELKTGVLGVSPETLKKHGAVSAPVALEMAEGARRRFRTDFALSITGVAGPTGGTPEKPVGLVYIGLAAAGRPTQVSRFMGHGDRHRIRIQSANAAMDILRKALKK